MSILALDPALSCGWAYEDRGDIVSGVWDLRGPDPSEHYGNRFVRFENELYAVLGQQAFSVLAYEDVHYGSKGAAAGVMRAGMLAILAMVAAKNQLTLCPCRISSVKLFATGKGNAKKFQMMDACHKRLGIAPRDDNEADAIWVLKFAEGGPRPTVKEQKRRAKKQAEKKQPKLF